MAEGRRPTISETELDILKVLWEHGPATVRAINDRLRRLGRRWAYTTVLTLLSRLESKGYVASDKSGVILFCRLLRPSPAARHALWLVVLLKLVTPPFYSMPLPFSDWVPSRPSFLEPPSLTAQSNASALMELHAPLVIEELPSGDWA